MSLSGDDRAAQLSRGNARTESSSAAMSRSFTSCLEDSCLSNWKASSSVSQKRSMRTPLAPRSRRARPALHVPGARCNRFRGHPPIEAAGIHLGTTRFQAHRQCLVLGEPSAFCRGDEANPSLLVERPSGLSIFVYPDDRDFVEAVEYGRPQGGEGIVRYWGRDLFGTPAATWDAYASSPTHRGPGTWVFGDRPGPATRLLAARDS